MSINHGLLDRLNRKRTALVYKYVYKFYKTRHVQYICKYIILYGTVTAKVSFLFVGDFPPFPIVFGNSTFNIKSNSNDLMTGSYPTNKTSYSSSTS